MAQPTRGLERTPFVQARLQHRSRFSEFFKTLQPLPELRRGRAPLIESVPVLTEASKQQILEKNALSSPFLRLPPDIRFEIYKCLLGNRLIHLRLPTTISPGWRHVVCQRDIPDDFYPDMKELVTSSYSSDEWEPAHRDCRFETWYDPRPGSSTYQEFERMHLTVLRTCRQIYHEANHVLWSTNLFSLHNPDAVLQFMSRRTTDQLALITKLRLRFDFQQQDEITIRRRALTSDFFTAMTSLRSLTLIIQDTVDDRLVALRGITDRSTFTAMDRYVTADLYEMSRLNLHTLHLCVLPPFPLDESRDHWEETQMSKAAAEWRSEHARRIRAFLMHH